MQINWKREVLPHVYAIIAFIVLAFVYCYPVLNGEEVRQPDMIQVEGMAHEAKQFYEKTGEAPLWSNNMFGGMPTYMVYTGPSSNQAAILNKLTTLWMPEPVNMLFIAMLGMYFLLAVLGFKYWVRLFGAAAYGFSSYNVIIISVGHITKMLTMAWMAPVLAGVLLIYHRKYLIGGIVTTLSAMLLIYNNHYQIIYYTAILLVCLVVWRFIYALKEKQLRSFLVASLICLGTGVLAALPSLPHIMVTKEYAKYSIRDSQSQLTLKDNNNTKIAKEGLDIDYAFQWSLGKLETFSVLIPNIYGGPPHSKDFLNSSATYEKLTQLGAGGQQAAGLVNATLYWGPQPFTSPVYFGAIICFLFILSLFLIRSKHKWWLLAVTLLSILMAWGSNFEAFNSFLFHHLPMYNKFRTPSMIMVIPQLTFVIMACWALSDVLSGKADKKFALEALKKALYVTVGLIILLWIIVSGLLNYTGAGDARLSQQLGQKAMDMLSGSIHEDRASLFRYDALRSLLFIAAVFVILWAYLKDKLKPVSVFVLLSFLLIIDLFVLDKRYLNKDNFVPETQLASHYQPTPADQQLLQDSTDFRVLNLSVGINGIFNDAVTSYFHKSIGGYSPAKLWRYQDLIDHQLMPALQSIYGAFQSKESLDSSVFSLLNSYPVLNMLNTKYFIINPNGMPVLNPAALGNAWFVDSIHWVENANEEMLALDHLKPAKTAVVNVSFKAVLGSGEPEKDSAAYIRLTHYGLNKMEYTSQNMQAGVGVFSEIYYPQGWKAYIDGKEAPIIRVNYVLRGLEIPAGKHEIVFKFHPDIFFTGRTLSGISSSVIILLILIGLGYDFYRKHKRTAKS